MRCFARALGGVGSVLAWIGFGPLAWLHERGLVRWHALWTWPVGLPAAMFFFVGALLEKAADEISPPHLRRT